MIGVDALSFLAKQAVAASAPTAIPGVDPREKTYLSSDGTFYGVQTKPPARQHTVLSLADIVNIANRFKDDEGATPVVWYSEKSVSVVFDDAGHRLETAVFPLVFSDKWEVAKALRNAGPKAHRDFVRFLRVQFAGVDEADSLADRLESIRFKDEQTVTGKVLRASESMGRSITSEAQAEDPIPDVVSFSILVYKVAGFGNEYDVRFVLDVNAEDKTFRLVPFPDEIEAIQQSVMDDVALSLEDGLVDGIPYYYGAP